MPLTDNIFTLGTAERIYPFVIGHVFPAADISLVAFGLLLFLICCVDIGCPSMGCQLGIVFFAFVPRVSWQGCIGLAEIAFHVCQNGGCSAWAYPLSAIRHRPNDKFRWSDGQKSHTRQVGRTSLPCKAKFHTVRILSCRCGESYRFCLGRSHRRPVRKKTKDGVTFAVRSQQNP